MATITDFSKITYDATRLKKCLLLSLQSRGEDVEAKTSYVSSAQRCIRNAAKWVCSSIDIPSCVANLVVKVSPRKGR